jgi:transcription elongation factor Elf1
MVKSKVLDYNFAKSQALGFKDNETFIEYNFFKCPYCKKEINIYVPTVKKGHRKELSKCTDCRKDFVVDIEVKEVKIKYDIKLRKVL